MLCLRRTTLLSKAWRIEQPFRGLPRQRRCRRGRPQAWRAGAGETLGERRRLAWCGNQRIELQRAREFGFSMSGVSVSREGKRRGRFPRYGGAAGFCEEVMAAALAACLAACLRDVGGEAHPTRLALRTPSRRAGRAKVPPRRDWRFSDGVAFRMLYSDEVLGRHYRG